MERWHTGSVLIIRSLGGRWVDRFVICQGGVLEYGVLVCGKSHARMHKQGFGEAVKNQVTINVSQIFFVAILARRSPHSWLRRPKLLTMLSQDSRIAFPHAHGPGWQ